MKVSIPAEYMIDDINTDKFDTRPEPNKPIWYYTNAEYCGYSRRIWVTRDGTRIFVSTLNDFHLVAIVNKLIRSGYLLQLIEVFDLYEASFIFDGDNLPEMESSDEDDILRYLSQSVPTFDALYREVTKRGLENKLKFDTSLLEMLMGSKGSNRKHHG